MRHLKLVQLKLSYFKGCKDFTLVANGEDVTIYGNNATGKTTIFDAVTFLLFDKDSENKSPGAFGIKTTDENGKTIEGVNHEVEGVFQFGAAQITLKKVYKEVWTKKRGSLISESTGNTTDYFYDGVSMSKGEYEERVEKIISEKHFKLLTNPRYFSEMTKDYKERREILIASCGDISDEDIIARNPKIVSFPSVLDGKTIEDRTKIINSRRAAINDEIKSIPDRIDEVRRGVPDTSKLSTESTLSKQISDMRGKVEEKEAEITRIQSGSEITVKHNRIREIEGELQQIKNQAEADSYKNVSAQRGVVDDLKRDADFLTSGIRKEDDQIKANDVTIFRNNDEINGLRNRFALVNDEAYPAFEHHGEDSCAACKQSLPADQVQAAHDRAKDAHDKAVAEFNQYKSNRLEGISVQGKALKEEVLRLESGMADSKTSVERLGIQLSTSKDRIQDAQAKLFELEGFVQKADANPAYIAKQTEMDAVEEEMRELRESTQEAAQRVRDEIQVFRDDVTLLEQNKSKFDHVRKADVRINELKGQERTLAAEYEKTEYDLWIIAEFTKQKVSMLESKINSRFSHTRFKLFEIQQNGGLKDMCEATNLEGVPYNAGLNNAGRLTCGMDIINVLTEYFDLALPVIIDNAEGISSPIGTHGQQIRLTVSARDTKLRVENTKVREAV